MRKLSTLEELVEQASLGPSVIEAYYAQDSLMAEKAVQETAIHDDDQEFLGEYAKFIFLRDVPLDLWSDEDFKNFDVIVLRAAERELGYSIVDYANGTD